MKRLTVMGLVALAIGTVLGLASLAPLSGAETGHTTPIYREQGGTVFTIDSGGTLGVESGGTVTAKSGSTTNLNGTTSIGGATTVASGGSVTVASGATHTVAAGGTLAVAGAVTLPAATLAVTTPLTVAMSGQDIVNTADDIVLTLPTAAAGLRYGFHVGSIAGATGLTIAVSAPAKLHGNGFTAASAKGAINTHATARDGDTISVFCDGTDWWITAINGTWARVP